MLASPMRCKFTEGIDQGDGSFNAGPTGVDILVRLGLG